MSVCAALVLGIVLAPHAASAASVVVDIPESYATVTAGERLYFQINFLYPENTRRQDFRIKYRVWEGEMVLASAEFLKAVETQASFTDYVVIPETAKPGIHTVEVDIFDDTGTAVAKEVSLSFQVKAADDWITTYFYVLLGTIVLVGVVIIVDTRRVLWKIMRERMH